MLNVPWEVTCDGSAITQTPDGGGRFPGGWAAVVEHESDGEVLRGGVASTTSTRMELTAAMMGLRRVPDGEKVLLVSDCTVVWMVHDRWRRKTLPGLGQLSVPKDIDLWRALAEEFDRLGTVTVRDIPRRCLVTGEKLPGDPIHARCHGIANAEARRVAQEAGYTPQHLPREEQERRAQVRAERKRRARELEHRLARSAEQIGFPKIVEAWLDANRDIPHHKHCRDGRCVSECIHFRHVA